MLRAGERVTDTVLSLHGAAEASAPVASPRPAFLPHVHRLRGLAMLLVVGAHCWPEFGWDAVARSRLLLVFDNVTVVFVAISGLLFHHLSVRFAYPRYLRHRSATVLLPYAVISMPAIAAAVFWRHRADVWPWLYQLPKWEEALVFLATGKHLAPLWFIPVMALFILASPVILWVERRGWLPVLLPPLLVFAVMMGRDWMSGPLNMLGKAVFLLPAYLAGMAWSRHRAEAERWAAAYWPVLLAAILLLSWAMAVQLAGYDWAILQKLTAAALLLVVLARATLPAAIEAGSQRIAAWSFAVYFVHGYVITAVRIGWELLGLPRPAGAPDGVILPASLPLLLVDIALVVAVSMVIIGVVKRLTGRWSRYLIGA